MLAALGLFSTSGFFWGKISQVCPLAFSLGRACLRCGRALCHRGPALRGCQAHTWSHRKLLAGSALVLEFVVFLFWKITIMGWIFISCKKTHRLNTDQDGSRWFGLNSWMVWVDNSFFLCGLFTFGNTLRIAQPKLSQVFGGKSAWDDMSVMVRFLPRTRMRLTMSNVWCWRRTARRL